MRLKAFELVVDYVNESGWYSHEMLSIIGSMIQYVTESDQALAFKKLAILAHIKNDFNKIGPELLKLNDNKVADAYKLMVDYLILKVSSINDMILLGSYIKQFYPDISHILVKELFRFAYLKGYINTFDSIFEVVDETKRLAAYKLIINYVDENRYFIFKLEVLIRMLKKIVASEQAEAFEEYAKFALKKGILYQLHDLFTNIDENKKIDIFLKFLKIAQTEECASYNFMVLWDYTKLLPVRDQGKAFEELIRFAYTIKCEGFISLIFDKLEPFDIVSKYRKVVEVSSEYSYTKETFPILKSILQSLPIKNYDKLVEEDKTFETLARFAHKKGRLKDFDIIFSNLDENKKLKYYKKLLEIVNDDNYSAIVLKNLGSFIKSIPSHAQPEAFEDLTKLAFSKKHLGLLKLEFTNIVVHKRAEAYEKAFQYLISVAYSENLFPTLDYLFKYLPSRYHDSKFEALLQFAYQKKYLKELAQVFDSIHVDIKLEIFQKSFTYLSGSKYSIEGVAFLGSLISKLALNNQVVEFEKLARLVHGKSAFSLILLEFSKLNYTNQLEGFSTLIRVINDNNPRGSIANGDIWSLSVLLMKEIPDNDQAAAFKIFAGVVFDYPGDSIKNLGTIISYFDPSQQVSSFVELARLVHNKGLDCGILAEELKKVDVSVRGDAYLETLSIIGHEYDAKLIGALRRA